MKQRKKTEEILRGHDHNEIEERIQEILSNMPIPLIFIAGKKEEKK